MNARVVSRLASSLLIVVAAIVVQPGAAVDRQRDPYPPATPTRNDRVVFPVNDLVDDNGEVAAQRNDRIVFDERVPDRFLTREQVAARNGPPVDIRRDVRIPARFNRQPRDIIRGPNRRVWHSLAFAHEHPRRMVRDLSSVATDITAIAATVKPVLTKPKKAKMPPPPVIVYTVRENDDDDDDDEKKTRKAADEERKNNATRAIIEQANEKLLNATTNVELKTSETVALSLNETRQMLKMELERNRREVIERVLNETRKYLREAIEEITRTHNETLGRAFAGKSTKSLHDAVSETSSVGSSSPVSCDLTEQQKAERDAKLLENVSIFIESRDDEDPERVKLVKLTPLLLARRMRSMMQATKEKGMVSVCYHNQPAAFQRNHPLAPNDTSPVSALFNGTMDAMHNPAKGRNLDTANYVNSLILELKSMGRDYVSVCWENTQSNLDFFHDTQCANVLVTRNKTTNDGNVASTVDPETTTTVMPIVP